MTSSALAQPPVTRSAAVGRKAADAAPWFAAAAALSVAAGLGTALNITAALDVAALLVIAAAVAWRPYLALVALMAARAAGGSLIPTFLSVGSVGLAVALVRPATIPRKVAVPMFVLLVLTVWTVPVQPSLIDGPRHTYLLPVFKAQYLGALSISMTQWLGVASILAMFCLAAWSVRSIWQLNRLIAVILVSAVYPIFDGLRQYAAGDLTVKAGGTAGEFRAVRGPFTEVNEFALYLVVVIAIALVAWMETRSKLVRLGLTALLVGASACLFLTYTRSAWVGLAIVIVMLGVLRYRALLVGGLVVMAVAGFAFPTQARQAQGRFGDLSTRNAAHATNSWNWRTGQWKQMLKYGWQKPVLGQGFGSYQRVSIRQFGLDNRHYRTVDGADPFGKPRGLTPHNDFVGTFVENGLVGLGLWLAALLGLLATAVRARRYAPVSAIATGMVALMTALLVMSFSDAVRGYTVVLVTTGVVIGGLAGVMARARRQPAPSNPS